MSQLTRLLTHQVWSHDQARELLTAASDRLCRRTRRARWANQGVMGLGAFCLGVGLIRRDTTLGATMLVIAAVLAIVAYKIAQVGMSPEIELRRWEHDVGFPEVSDTQLEAIARNAAVPAAVRQAIARWQALGYVIRLRDLRVLVGAASENGVRIATPEDDYFSYVLMGQGT